MKALTVAQPWASLIIAGRKTIETRPAPPNGPMRPDGARGLPGLRIERGERIAIHAAAAKPDEWDEYGDWRIHEMANGEWRAYHLIDGEEVGVHDSIVLPFGAVLGTVEVLDAVPIVDEMTCTQHPDVPSFIAWSRHHGTATWLTFRHTSSPTWYVDKNLTETHRDQLPLGDFTPGRWAWLLGNPERHALPRPVRGRQGVWEWHQ